jgi:hypothetical protein
MTRYATASQAALIRKLMQSHVVTESERAGLEFRLARGFDKGTPTEAVDWLLETVKARKAAEKAEAEAQQAGLNL